jgi:DNA polymerase-4
MSIATRSTPRSRSATTRAADKPLIIGGGKRGVVSTACYMARTFGVRSAMPMFKARALPPRDRDPARHGEIRPRRPRGAQLMQALTPQVEPLSIDEAFMDL